MIFKVISCGLLVVIMACSPGDDILRDSRGKPYLNQFQRNNSNVENDCSLPACSEERVSRFTFREVYGVVINDSTITVHSGRDGIFTLKICGPTLQADQEIIFSGIGHDACGLFMPSYAGQDGYFLYITSFRNF